MRRQAALLVSNATPKMQYVDMLNTDDTAPTYANMYSGLDNGMDMQLDHAEIVFYGTDAEDETITFSLFLQTKDGPAELIATGNIVLGDVLTGNANEYYANSITITAENWLNAITICGADNDDGQIAKLAFDGFGYDKIQLFLSTGTAASAGAKIRWF